MTRGTPGTALGWLGQSPLHGGEEPLWDLTRPRPPGRFHIVYFRTGTRSPSLLPARSSGWRLTWKKQGCKGAGLWTVPPPQSLRPIKVPRPHISASRVPWSLLQSVFQANVKTQVSSHLLCWDPHLRVDSRVTTAFGPAQRGWPEKSPQSFPVNASWRGQAGVLRGGKAWAPATLVLEL